MSNPHTLHIPEEAVAEPPPRASSTGGQRQHVTDKNAGRLRKYALAALNGEADQLASMRGSSGRNNKLRDAAFSIAGYISHDLVTADEIESALMTAAEACGLIDDDGEDKTLDTLRRSIDAGEASPRDLPVPKAEGKFSFVGRADNADTSAADLEKALAAALELVGAATGAEQTKAIQAALVALARTLPDPLTVDQHLRDISAATSVTLGALRDGYKAAANSVADDEGQGGGERKSTATELIEQALEEYALKISDSGEEFAVPKSGPRVAHLLRGGHTSLRASLAREYFKRHERAAPQQSLADAMATLAGFAQEAEPSMLYQRVAQHDGAQWLDLGDNTGAAVRITASGWTIEQAPPVHFRRTPLTAALPAPERGGKLEELWQWLHVTPEDRPLVLAWIVAVFYPNIPHPIVGLFGEQGSGKTTNLRLLVQLLDPSPVPYRKPPKDADSWITAAAGSWLVGLDNLSAVNAWLSDTLCRAVTGEGDVRRKLYSDSDLATFSFRRCIALTSIDLGSTPGDLAERLLPATLDVIPEEARRDETTMWAEWEDTHPRLLGAILDLVAGVAGVLPTVSARRLPRMADYARILAAVDQLHSTQGFDRYLGSQGRLALDTLAGDPFITAVTESITEPWEGTAAQLLASLEASDEVRRSKKWPDNARAVTQRLRRQAPVMRKTGWAISDDGGQNKDGVTRWSISPAPRESGKDAPPNPPNPPARAGRDKPGGASPAGANGDTRQPRLDNPPDPPTDTMPRQENAVLHGSTGQAGKAGQESRQTLGGAEAPPEVKRLYRLWRAGHYSAKPEQQELADIFSQPQAAEADRARLIELADKLLAPPPGAPL